MELSAKGCDGWPALNIVPFAILGYRTLCFEHFAAGKASSRAAATVQGRS